jgi:hypothetical protein
MLQSLEEGELHTWDFLKQIPFKLWAVRSDKSWDEDKKA